MISLTRALALVVLAAGASGATAATYVNRIPDGSGGYDFADLEILAGQSQTWTAAGSPYIVERDVLVDKGGSLTIEPGVTVQFMPWEAWHGLVLTGLYVNGTLAATGSATGRISFTSGLTPQEAGDWNGIYLGADAGASTLRYCDIAYAGSARGIGRDGNGRAAAILVDKSAPIIDHCTIADSQSTGIMLNASRATVQDTHFHELGADSVIPPYPIWFESPDTFPALSGNTVSGKGQRAVSASGGTSSLSGRWRLPGPDLVYHMRASYTFAEGTTFTLDPGVTVRLADFNTGLFIYGTLLAQGTADLPITLTGMKTEPAPGDWLGIYLSPASGGSSLSYCTLSNGASSGYNANGLGVFHGASRWGCLWVDACSPTITHCTFIDNHNDAIGLYASRATIRDNTFHNVYTTSHDILFETPDCFPDMEGNTATGTGVHGVGVRGGTGAASGRWPLGGPDFAYDLLGDVTFASGTTLALDPGVTVAFGWQYGLYVNGTLRAPGTSSAPIAFTSDRPDATNGYWKGIYLGPEAGASVLSHCAFLHGGVGLGIYHGADRYGMLVIDSCSPSITDCAFRESSSHGMEVYGGRPVIRRNTFQEICGYFGDGFAIHYGTPDTFADVADNAGSTSKGTIGIGVAGGSIASSGTWKLAGADFPYILTGDVAVDAPATLAIAPGVTVKASGQTGLYVNGTLSAAGTVSAPITFTTRYGPPNPSAWRGIYLGPGSGASILEHCTLAYGGSGLGNSEHGYRDGCLFVDTAAPAIECITVSDSLQNGIQLYASSATIANSVVVRSGIDGLRATAGSAPMLLNMTVADSRYAGVRAVDSSPVLVNTIVSHSSEWGVRKEGSGNPVLRSSTVAMNGSGDYLGLPDPTGENGNLRADPRFVNRAAGDLHLASDSPCIDTGQDSAVPAGATDREGGPRIRCGRVDIGAYEFAGTPSRYVLADVLTVLKIAGGLLVPDSAVLQRLNVEVGSPPAARLDLSDAVRLMRKVAGMDANP